MAAEQGCFPTFPIICSAQVRRCNRFRVFDRDRPPRGQNVRGSRSARYTRNCYVVAGVQDVEWAGEDFRLTARSVAQNRTSSSELSTWEEPTREQPDYPFPTRHMDVR